MKQWTILISLTVFLLTPLTSIFSAETPLKIVNVAGSGGVTVAASPRSETARRGIS
jgi:hypothetical protein